MLQKLKVYEHQREILCEITVLFHRCREKKVSYRCCLMEYVNRVLRGPVSIMFSRGKINVQ